MRGYPTTFLGLFGDQGSERSHIDRIEIPIIQRDFAQGRPDDESTAIRERFLYALVQAITNDEELGLDFIYGDVENGVFRPLDGQQRLTTLFLLHWYIASLANEMNEHDPWLKFSYATRPSARDFTAALASHPFPGDGKSPSEWITDQPWYVYPWRQDPTISSMLAMLDAIHERLTPGSFDSGALWKRLSTPSTEDSRGTIWFLFLPVTDADHGEDLYIKMNSRGKTLTRFEVFKADFESIIKDVDPDRYQHLIDSIDGTWADLLWQYEKRSESDFKIDDEFERYLTFILDVCDWWDGAPDRKWHDKEAQRIWPLEERARLTFADPSNPNATRNRDFFFHAFDTWVGVNPHELLGSVFDADGEGAGALPLFTSTSDLFGACIAKYGSEFSTQETLMLFGVLLARQKGESLDSHLVQRKLRSLRNVSAANLNRDRQMSRYIASTEKIMRANSADDLTGLGGFNEVWVADEAFKWRMNEYDGTAEILHQIEDSPVLRGRVMAFDLDPARLPDRTNAFKRISDSSLRDLLGAALLTKGDYSRAIDWYGNKRQLGSSQKEDSWMDLLTTGRREDLGFIRDPLMSLLDDVYERIQAQPDAGKVLEAIREEWLAARSASRKLDWRYYLVKYRGARSNKGDGYYLGTYDKDRGGFNYGKLRILHGSDYRADFSDALLRAAWVDGALSDIADEPSWRHQYNLGLTLKKSRIDVVCEDEGFAIIVPLNDDALDVTVTAALSPLGCSEDLRVSVQQARTSGWNIDIEDRVQVCERIVRLLAKEGL